MGAAGRAGPDADITRVDVIRAGRRQFLRGERVDLVALAQELGIARATVYRWVGRQDEVVGEVMASLTLDTLDGVLAERPGTGPGYVADVIVETLAITMAHPHFAAFLTGDPGRALSILTGPGSRVVRALTARFRELVEAHCPEAVGEDLSAHDLAQGLLKLSEAYCYADLTTGRPLDVGGVRPLFMRLLGAT